MSQISTYNHWFTNEKPGWHEFSAWRTNWAVDDWIQRNDAMLDWIQENIEMPYRHARWTLNLECSTFRFRYERNFLVFVLRWAP